MLWLTAITFLGMVFFPALYGMASRSVNVEHVKKSSMEEKSSPAVVFGTIDGIAPDQMAL